MIFVQHGTKKVPEPLFSEKILVRGLYRVELDKGLEPSTGSLQNCCSTN